MKRLKRAAAAPEMWFRVDADGNVVGHSRNSLEMALRNLPAGMTLLPFDASVNHRSERWDADAGAWVKKVEEEPIEDAAFMRRTGYPSLGDQVGVLMKLVGPLLAGEPPPAESVAEFKRLSTQIERMKRDHPLK